jgi:ribonuclease HI
MEKWLPGWKKRHWKASDGDPIKHTDLWMPIDALLAVHRVTVERPTTPTAIQLNARMDQLANQAAVKQLKNALTPLGT